MTIQIHSVNNSGYVSGSNSVFWNHGSTLDTVGKYPGMVIGISIFGDSMVDYIEDDLAKRFTFIRADNSTSDPLRSELWYCQNFELSVNTLIGVQLTDVADFVVGSAVYNYFGGIGFHDGGMGASTPAAELAELEMFNRQIDSILFSNLCISSVTDVLVLDQNLRWSVDDGVSYHGLGSDFGPMTHANGYIMSYQTTGISNWVTSGVELLDYQDSPPAAIGM